MQRLRRFAKYWDLVGNSGNFVGTTPLIWGAESPFASFLRFSDWLYARIARTDSIALARLAELLFEFLTGEVKLEQPASPNDVAQLVARRAPRGAGIPPRIPARGKRAHRAGSQILVA